LHQRPLRIHLLVLENLSWARSKSYTAAAIRIFHSLLGKCREMRQNSLPCGRWNTLKLLALTSPFRLHD
jgi:hypothetical protein